MIIPYGIQSPKVQILFRTLSHKFAEMHVRVVKSSIFDVLMSLKSNVKNNMLHNVTARLQAHKLSTYITDPDADDASMTSQSVAGLNTCTIGTCCCCGVAAPPSAWTGSVLLPRSFWLPPPLPYDTVGDGFMMLIAPGPNEGGCCIVKGEGIGPAELVWASYGTYRLYIDCCWGGGGPPLDGGAKTGGDAERVWLPAAYTLYAELLLNVTSVGGGAILVVILVCPYFRCSSGSDADE